MVDELRVDPMNLSTVYTAVAMYVVNMTLYQMENLACSAKIPQYPQYWGDSVDKGTETFVGVRDVSLR